MNREELRRILAEGGVSLALLEAGKLVGYKEGPMLTEVELLRKKEAKAAKRKDIVSWRRHHNPQVNTKETVGDPGYMAGLKERQVQRQEQESLWQRAKRVVKGIFLKTRGRG